MFTISKTYEEQSTTVIPMENLIANKKNFFEILKANNVAILPLSISKEERNEALADTKFYNTANDVLKGEFRIEEPTLEQKLDPKTIVNKAPDSAQGWIHQYATPVHNLVQKNRPFRSVMKKLYGKQLKYKPNRIRVCNNNKRSTHTIHFDGHPFIVENGVIGVIGVEEEHISYNDKPLISTIVGLTGTRGFVWWDVKDKPIKPLYDYWKKKGEKHFTSIDTEFMYTHYPDCRRTVYVDCSETIYLIGFLENIPHEICNTPSLSLFLSPVHEFNHRIIRKTTTFQVKEFEGLTEHETDLLAICYQMGGSHWPSGKKLYQSYHPRAYSHYNPRTNDYYKDANNQKHQMRLVRNGNIDQHTIEYQTKLSELDIKLPEIAFHENTSNFVVDITTFTRKILRDYGFIQ
jgi:hypothetical protein